MAGETTIGLRIGWHQSGRVRGLAGNWKIWSFASGVQEFHFFRGSTIASAKEVMLQKFCKIDPT